MRREKLTLRFWQARHLLTQQMRPATVSKPVTRTAAAIVEESAQGMIGSLQTLADAGGVHFLPPNAPQSSEAAWTRGAFEADTLAERCNAILEAGLAAVDGDLWIVYFDLACFA